MDSERLKECVRIAKEAVEGEDEPYKTEGYKIILAKLITMHNSQPTENHSIKEQSSKNFADHDVDNGKNNLAMKCGITYEQLNDIISIKDDQIEFIAPIEGSDAKKHIIVSLCLLVINEFIWKREWLESTKIAETLRAIGVKDLANLSYTLKRYPSLIRTRGSRGLGKEYRLTSNDGRTKAFEVIAKLAKSEEIII